MKLIRMKLLPRDVKEFFINLVSETIEDREKRNFVRKDLMQYLIQLRNGDVAKHDDVDDWNIKTNGERYTRAF